MTHDARTLRYPHPDISVHDTVKLELGTNKVLEHLKFEIGMNKKIKKTLKLQKISINICFNIKRINFS